jgi:putative chitinase
MSYDQIGWTRILAACGVNSQAADAWAPYTTKVLLDTTFDGGHEELAQFLGQCLHETQMINRTSENLDYSPQGLLATFGTDRISAEDAQKYGRSDGQHPADQRMIANLVYGGLWGIKNLGNKGPNDGWNYRGGGWIQTTGFNNYLSAEKGTDIPFSKNPDLMREIGAAPIEAAVAWWRNNITVQMLTNELLLRQKVNGPKALGFQDCHVLTIKARTALAAVPENPD